MFINGLKQYSLFLIWQVDKDNCFFNGIIVKSLISQPFPNCFVLLQEQYLVP